MKGTRRGKKVFSFSDAVVIAQTHEQTKALVIAAMNQVKELLRSRDLSELLSRAAAEADTDVFASMLEDGDDVFEDGCSDLIRLLESLEEAEASFTGSEESWVNDLAHQAKHSLCARMARAKAGVSFSASDLHSMYL